MEEYGGYCQTHIAYATTYDSVASKVLFQLDWALGRFHVLLQTVIEENHDTPLAIGKYECILSSIQVNPCITSHPILTNLSVQRLCYDKATWLPKLGRAERWPWRLNSPNDLHGSLRQTLAQPTHNTIQPCQTTSGPATHTVSEITVASHAKAVSEAARPQIVATDRAVHESAAAGAMPATVHDRPTEEMSAKGGDEAGTEAEAAMIADEVATTGEGAETIAPTSATAHHNHQKAREAAPEAHSAVAPSPQLDRALQLMLLSRRRHRTLR